MSMFDFSNNSQIQELLSLDRDLSDLASASAVLHWDQEVNLPVDGAENRAKQQSTLAGIVHDRAVNPRIGELLTSLEEQVKVSPDTFSQADKSLVIQIRRDFDLSTKLPKQLVQDISEATSLGLAKWIEARNENNFAVFIPAFERTLELLKEEANYLGDSKLPYDALLDLYEPQATETWIKSIFDPLKHAVVHLLKQIESKELIINDDILHANFDEDKQMLFGKEVAGFLGLNWQASRIDISTHPFTTSLGGSSDVRITTRMKQDDITYSLMSVIHETGHAVYEQNVNPNLNRTTLFGGTSLGIHESQSRFFENRVGRSHAFWHFWYPRVREFFPEELPVDGERDLYRAINKVMPSLIRVQADEVTYNLHIILRFELESDLINGRIQVKDLPEAWNQKMKEYLGVVPNNDKEGVLQDIHWAHGSIGYFPTYALGNLYGAQLFTKMDKDVHIDEQLLKGDFSVVLSWLKENVHQWGRMYYPKDLIRRITGEEINSQYFIDYLTKKYSEIYELS